MKYIKTFEEIGWKKFQAIKNHHGINNWGEKLEDINDLVIDEEYKSIDESEFLTRNPMMNTLIYKGVSNDKYNFSKTDTYSKTTNISLSKEEVLKSVYKQKYVDSKRAI